MSVILTSWGKDAAPLLDQSGVDYLIASVPHADEKSLVAHQSKGLLSPAFVSSISRT